MVKRATIKLFLVEQLWTKFRGPDNVVAHVVSGQKRITMSDRPEINRRREIPEAGGAENHLRAGLRHRWSAKPEKNRGAFARPKGPVICLTSSRTS